MIKKVQEYLATIQIRRGNVPLLEWLMARSFENLKKDFPDIWIRNSYYFKAHHPLASDIDLSFKGSMTTAKEIFNRTRKNKLLGELNFYPTDITSDLIQLANPYELLRDPLLVKANEVKKGSLIQKEVFLFRHIIGDIYWLKINPTIRKKKWGYILSILNLNPPSELTLSTLLDLVENQLPLKSYLQADNQNLFDYFKNSPYRCYFPHKHIWDSTDLSYLTDLSGDEKEFLLEQVKWEFWGIGTQLHWINLEISHEFLARLKNVVIHIGVKSSELQAMENILNFIQKWSQATR